VKQQRLLEGRQVEELVSSGAGGEFRTLVGHLEWFEFAGRRFEKPETEFRTMGVGREGGAGVIGRELLAPFVTVFDYPNRRIAFVPVKRAEDKQAAVR
jgi:hypothetical protein